MNGILGSYHTNNHHISVQLANKFLNYKSYAPLNWPRQFSQEYLPMLQRFSYNKVQENIDSELTCLEPDISPPPPIREGSFTSSEIDSLSSIFDDSITPNTYDILILHNRTKALLTGGFVIGAKGSCHTSSTLVLVSGLDGNYLAEIQYFACCVLISKSDCKHLSSNWVAAVSPFMEHQCAVWFGRPAQVWSTATYPGLRFIPVQKKNQSRVISTKSVVNFGSIMGEESVLVITPLPHT